MLNTRKIAIAAGLLKQGGVIVYPTEAVWGVGCDPQNHKAVMRLLAMKNREWQKGLILIAAHIEQVEPYIDMPSRMAWRRATATWPGASTWVFPATDYCPMWISGERSTVAVRVTAHPLAARLCDEFGGAIVSTSANRAGVALRQSFQASADDHPRLGERQHPAPLRFAVAARLLHFGGH